MKTNSLILILTILLPLAACKTVPMYTHVNTEGNKINVDNGPKDDSDNNEFCPPEQAPQNNC